MVSAAGSTIDTPTAVTTARGGGGARKPASKIDTSLGSGTPFEEFLTLSASSRQRLWQSAESLQRRMLQDVGRKGLILSVQGARVSFGGSDPAS